MDTESLKAFISVVENASFSLAGEELHLTQPAVSKRIQSLEKLLNVQLFDRSQKKLLLTDAGKQLVAPAIQVLKETQNLKLTAQNLHKKVTGELRITCSHHIGLHRLPPVLQKFSSLYPEVDLQFSFAESEKAHRELQNNQTDLAFITLDKDYGEIFNAHLTLTDPMNFVCSHTHALSEKSSLTLDQLATYDAVLPDSNTYMYQLVNRHFTSEGLKLKARMPTNYLETIKMMINAGLGWSVLPDLMIDESLHVLKVSHLKVARNIGIVTLQNRVISKASEAFIATTQSIWN